MTTLPMIASGDRSGRAWLTLRLLALLLAVVAVLSLGTGASGLSVYQLGSALTGEGLDLRDRIVLTDIRMPRLALGILIGAALAVSGALMQGLFRNPLADPGIIGVGAGASLGAVGVIVLGGLLPAGLAAASGGYLLPVAAFLGSWGATMLLYRLATRRGQTSIATLLLAGIALGAMAMALTGLLIFLADDRQLRDLTFWSMGSLAGANWAKVAASLPMILPVLLLSPLLARGLNALVLGEAQARHLGVRVQRIKRVAILAVAAATGAAVAVSGGIGFVGIVVPHLLRLATGPDHRFLLPNAALLGAILLLLADMLARTMTAPTELPIGIITAALGAPVFLWILLARRGFAEG